MTSGVARVVSEFEEEFSSELPALSVQIASSNPNILVDVKKITPFSIKFRLINKTDQHQLVTGSVAEERETFIIFGKTLHHGTESTVTEKIDRGATDSIDITSSWIQDKATAERIAKWVANRLSRSRISIDMEIMGTPVLEVGDIIRVYHHEVHINGYLDFVINKVGLSWSEGLRTSVRAVEL